MAQQRFKALRMEMYGADLDQETFGKALGKSRTYISNRLSSRYEWDMSDVYAICKLFDIPHEKIAEYFPPKPINGKEDKH
jgi:DNA-binding XRE family transcriptional regulator